MNVTGGKRSDSKVEDQAPKGGNFEFVDWGPPPDLAQRELIFDSLQKIVTTVPQKSTTKEKDKPKDNRGTYVFTWGAGYAGQLGRKFLRGHKKYSALPLLIDLDEVVRKSGLAIRQVACGGLHTAVVTESGQVYTWGDGSKGELGHIHDPSLKQTPRLVEDLENVFITQVACGRGHTVAMTDQGKVYSWGWNKSGQIGHGDRSGRKTPKQIEHPLARDITNIACGNKHTVLINKGGEVISFGCGKHGQTGLGHHTSNSDGQFFPVKIDSLAGVVAVSVACGAIHTCIVTTEGDIYLCGFGEYLHPSEGQHFNYTPTKLTLPEPVKQVAAGQSHNVALTTTGNVYCWGSGDYGQIGHGIRGNTAVPKLVIDRGDIAQISAGRYHSFALNTSGILWSWGCGENGQLGQNSDENIYLPRIVTPILGTVVGQVSCGEHHTAVLTSAPWTKLTNDVAELHYACKQEYALKDSYVNKTHRGLTRKDLLKIKDELKKWESTTSEKHSELLKQETEELQREVANIQYTGSLQDPISDRAEDLEKVNQFLHTQPLGDDHPSQDYHLTEVNATPLSAAFSSTNVKEFDPLIIHHPAYKMHFPHVPGAVSQQPQQSNDLGSKSARYPGAANNQHVLEGGLLPPLNKKAQTHRASSGSMQNTIMSPHNNAITTQQARTSFLKETAAMVKDMALTVMDKGESIQSKTVQKLVRQVFDAKREFDNIRHEHKSKTGLLEKLKSELSLLEQRENRVEDLRSQNNERIKDIEMRLNTVTIKIAETCENRQNYHTNIVHLKEEDFDNVNRLKSLQKETSDSSALYRKLDDIKQSAMSDRERADHELNEFRNEIDQYKTFVKSQFSQFEDILSVIRTQNDKREKMKDAQADKNRSKLNAKIDKLHEEARQTDEESHSLNSKLTALDLKLRHFEDSFTKVSAATGLTDPDAIVNKYFFKNEIREQLQNEINEKEALKQHLKDREIELKQKLIDTRRNHKDHTWRDVDQVSEVYRESEHRSKKAQNDQIATAQRLAFVQEGVLALSKAIGSAAVGHDDTYDYNSLNNAVTDSAYNASGNPPQDEISEDDMSGLWNPEIADRILTKIHIDLDMLLEAEKEVNSRSDQKDERLNSHWGYVDEPANDNVTIASPAVIQQNAYVSRNNSTRGSSHQQSRPSSQRSSIVQSRPSTSDHSQPQHNSQYTPEEDAPSSSAVDDVALPQPSHEPIQAEN